MLTRKPRLRIASAARSPSMPMRSGITNVVASSPRLSEQRDFRRAGVRRGILRHDGVGGVVGRSDLRERADLDAVLGEAHLRRSLALADQRGNRRHPRSGADPDTNGALSSRAHAGAGILLHHATERNLGVGAAILVDAKTETDRGERLGGLD